MRLKIYSDRSLVAPGERYVLLLYPFWGALSEPEGDKDAGRFDEYARLGQGYFQWVAELREADLAVFPIEWRPANPGIAERARLFCDRAAALGKRVAVFFNHDSMEPVPFANAIVFRTSFYRSLRRPNEYATPAWSLDFLPGYLGGVLPVREKGALPVVGYCGYLDTLSDALPRRWLETLRLRLNGARIGAVLRGKAIRALLKDGRVQLNFLRRDGFCGDSQAETRRAYVQNLVDSDYALVVRGAGNFSYRLYEVLSCGRIPIFVDTDCVLPFDDLIDWKKFSVWVDAAEIARLPRIVADFHQALTPADFQRMQRGCRQLYEQWLSPAAYFRNFWRCLGSAPEAEVIFPHSIGETDTSDLVPSKKSTSRPKA